MGKTNIILMNFRITFLTKKELLKMPVFSILQTSAEMLWKILMLCVMLRILTLVIIVIQQIMCEMAKGLHRYEPQFPSPFNLLQLIYVINVEPLVQSCD